MGTFPSYSKSYYAPNNGGVLVQSGPTFLQGIFVGGRNTNLVPTNVTVHDGVAQTDPIVLSFTVSTFAQPYTVDLCGQGIQLSGGLFVYQGGNGLAAPLTILYY